MIDYSAVRSPFSDELPCGPDLELEGDDDFLNYVAAAEGRLPASFFSFSRDSINLDDELRALSELLARTHDVRLLTLAAKFSILSGDLVGFADAVEAIDFLLTHRWNDVHPRGLDGDFALRRVQIESLDDMPSAALPLQYATLVRHRRHGTICLRSQFIAIGEVQPRDGETVLDAATIREALLTAEDVDDLKRRYDAVCRLEQALTSIPARYMEETNYSESLALERIPVLVHKIRELVEGPLGERDPSATTPAPDTGVHTPEAAGAAAEALLSGQPGTVSDAPRADDAVIRLDDLDAAVNALKAAERYFAGREPSNPCILLIRQALQLVGKSFIEAMQLLVPARMETATVQLGGSQALTIPINQLGPFAAADAGTGENGKAGQGATVGGEPKVFSADSRLEAVSLIAAAERYFVEFEPSSPVPLLLARARTYVNRDFFSLLNEFAPPAPPQ